MTRPRDSKPDGSAGALDEPGYARHAVGPEHEANSRKDSDQPSQRQAAPGGPTDPSHLDTHAPTLPVVERAAPAAAPGLRISSYRILGVLGEGSTGVVYRAEQENPRRVVALKVLKAGAASTRALARFEHEAQILGQLQHPAIAQIFEAGTADTGYGPQPFLAMEMIQGTPLTEYARAHRLSPRARLALLIKVCEGVQHAHLKGVIHRDLKPVNILVVEHEGQPKILDFGIALAADADGVGPAASMEMRQLAGTVPYMSVEQFEGDPHGLDTRADVYALGVIAYELLAERLPYDLHGKTIGQARRIVGQQRLVPLGLVNRVFRGDVEAIVAKALERDRERRYQSASELAADIRRHLADEPVWARPSRVGYRLGKFAKRNKVLVAGVAGVVIMMLAAIAGTTMGLRGARRAEAEARDVSAFLRDALLASAAPEEKGKDVTVRQALDAAAARIEQGALDGRPKVEAAVRTTLGSTYRRLGFLDTALPHLLRALEINRRVLGPSDEQALESMHELAVLHTLQGRYDQGEPLWIEVVELRRRELGDKHQHTLESRHGLGELRRLQGRYDEAEQLHRRTLENRKRELGPSHADTLKSMNALAILYRDQGRNEEAEALYREVVEVLTRSLGNEHPDTLKSMNNLALVLRADGRLSEAERLYLQTLRIERHVLGDEHQTTLSAMNNLARVYKEQGQLTEAQRLYEETLEIRGRTLGAEHPETLTSMNNLARLYHEQGKLAEARELYERALEVRRRALGEDHPGTLTVMNNLARLYHEQGKLAEARELYERALEVRRRALGEDHPGTLTVMNNLALVLQAQGELDRAEQLFRATYEGRRRRAGEDHPQTLTSMNNLALVLRDQGKLDAAERMYREAVETCRRALGEAHQITLWSMFSLADLLADKDQCTEAVSLHRHVLRGMRESLPEGHPRVARSLLELGKVLIKIDDAQSAEPLLRECLSIRSSRHSSSDDWRTAHAESVLGECLTALGRYEEAEPLLLKSYLVIRTQKGETDVHTRDAARRIRALYDVWARPDKVAAWQARVQSVRSPAADSSSSE